MDVKHHLPSLWDGVRASLRGKMPVSHKKEFQISNRNFYLKKKKKVGLNPKKEEGRETMTKWK